MEQGKRRALETVGINMLRFAGRGLYVYTREYTQITSAMRFYEEASKHAHHAEATLM